jgi:serralysin
MTANPENHFCMCPEPQEAQGQTRAAILKAYVWPRGTTITIKFLEGDPSLTRRVAVVARDWTGPGMANLRFQLVESGDADIRVAFQQGRGSWSYIGTQCRNIDKASPTMNYGWLAPSSPDDEVRRVVLHEFGHAIGLIHEHQNPNHPIQWNRDAVTQDLSGPPNNWDEQKIQTNMFAKYDLAGVIATPVDQDSIMMYPIPSSWTLDGFSAGMNRELSSQDKELIRKVYFW